MNNFDEKIKQIVSKDLELPEVYIQTINKTFNQLDNQKVTFKFNKLKFSLVASFCSLFLLVGIDFAKDIENFIKTQFENFRFK